MNEKPSSHLLRKGRVSLPGATYLVTTATHDRTPFFLDLPTARTVIRALAVACERGDASTLAYVLMPDHLHWLLTLTGTTPLDELIRQIKSVSAHRCGQRIWQAGYHDHAIRKEDSLLASARYIVANPVRAGLVRHVGDYPHWDAVWLA